MSPAASMLSMIFCLDCLVVSWWCGEGEEEKGEGAYLIPKERLSRGQGYFLLMEIVCSMHYVCENWKGTVRYWRRKAQLS